MTPQYHLERAIKHFGNMSRMAHATGYSQHAVWQATKRGQCSPRMALAIHKASKGRVNKRDLRPDIFGGEA